MIVSFDLLIPFVVHRDEIVRNYVVAHLLDHRAFLTKEQKKMLIIKVFLSIKHYGLLKNQKLISLLSFFRLSERRLKIFYFLYHRENKFIKNKKGNGSPLQKQLKKEWKDQLLDQLKKIFYFYSVDELYFLRDFLPLKFWSGYFNYARSQLVFKDILAHHKKSSEEVLWGFLKKYFLDKTKTKELLFQEKYLKSFLKIFSKKFSGKYRNEIRNFFLKCLEYKDCKDKKIVFHFFMQNDRLFSFYMGCVDTLKLRDIADILLDFFSMDCPKKVLTQVAKTLAGFSDTVFDREMFFLYFNPRTSPAQKDIIISFYFTFSRTMVREKYLLEIGYKEENLTRKMKVANALSYIFSDQFVAYAIGLCRKNNDCYVDFGEEIVIFSSILGVHDCVYFSFAREYFQNFVNKDYYSEFLLFDKKM